MPYAVISHMPPDRDADLQDPPMPEHLLFPNDAISPRIFSSEPRGPMLDLLGSSYPGAQDEPLSPRDQSSPWTLMASKLLRAFAILEANTGMDYKILPPMIMTRPYTFHWFPFPHFEMVRLPDSSKRKSWRRSFYEAVDTYVPELPYPLGLRSNAHPGTYVRHPALIQAGYIHTPFGNVLKSFADILLPDTVPEDPNDKSTVPRPKPGEELSDLPSELPNVPEELSLKGKTAVVTGGDSNIGYEVAKRFVLHGISSLVLGVHHIEEGNEARTKLLKEFHDQKKKRTGNEATALADAKAPEIFVLELELQDVDSVYRFSKALSFALKKRLDYAVLTAYTHYHHGLGRVKPQYRYRNSANEVALQINVISNAYLSVLLAPLLQWTSIQNGGEPTRMTFMNKELHKRNSFAIGLGAPRFPDEDILRYFNNPHHFRDTHRSRDLLLLRTMWARELSWRYVRPDFAKRGLGTVIVNDVAVPIFKGPDGPEWTTHYKTIFWPLLRWQRQKVGVELDVAADDFFKAVINGGQGGYYVNGKLGKPDEFLFTPKGIQVRHTLWNELGGQLLLFDRYSVHDFWADPKDTETLKRQERPPTKDVSTVARNEALTNKKIDPKDTTGTLNRPRLGAPTNGVSTVARNEVSTNRMGAPKDNTRTLNRPERAPTRGVGTVARNEALAGKKGNQK